MCGAWQFGPADDDPRISWSIVVETIWCAATFTCEMIQACLNKVAKDIHAPTYHCIVYLRHTHTHTLMLQVKVVDKCGHPQICRREPLKRLTIRTLWLANCETFVFQSPNATVAAAGMLIGRIPVIVRLFADVFDGGLWVKRPLKTACELSFHSASASNWEDMAFPTGCF